MPIRRSNRRTFSPSRAMSIALYAVALAIAACTHSSVRPSASSGSVSRGPVVITSPVPGVLTDSQVLHLAPDPATAEPQVAITRSLVRETLFMTHQQGAITTGCNGGTVRIVTGTVADCWSTWNKHRITWRVRITNSGGNSGVFYYKVEPTTFLLLADTAYQAWRDEIGGEATDPTCDRIPGISTIDMRTGSATTTTRYRCQCVTKGEDAHRVAAPLEVGNLDTDNGGLDVAISFPVEL